jgi:hypothetical protein
MRLWGRGLHAAHKRMRLYGESIKSVLICTAMRRWTRKTVNGFADSLCVEL